MLVPLTRKKFEEMIPLIATFEQYKYCWGNPSDFLRRLLISVVGVVVLVTLQSFLGEGVDSVLFVLSITAGLYWFWSPIYWASTRNIKCRRYRFSGFWQGEVLDVFVTEELIGKEETVNKAGELVIVENRERRLNLEVGDETGFVTQLQVPLKKEHRSIRPGDFAEMILMSNRADLSRINKVSDIYLPDYDLWVSDYPFLRRDVFMEVSRQIERRRQFYDD
jgi:hypothetical protein